MLKTPVYLIPFDFTPMAKNALKIGFDFAEANDGSVFLLHVVKKEADKKAATLRLNLFVNGLDQRMRNRIVSRVLDGNLYEEVGRAAEILASPLSIMATHGPSGLQKVFGSNALKMVAKTPTAFLVTVSEDPLKKIETIVMPFSFVKETLQILNHVCLIAKRFNSVIHLVGYHDEKVWLKKQSIENQKLAKEFLTSKGIPCEVVNLEKNGTYEDELSNYMFRVKADLIATAYFKNSILPPPNSFVQVLLDNDHQIPVLTVNADQLDVFDDE